LATASSALECSSRVTGGRRGLGKLLEAATERAVAALGAANEATTELRVTSPYVTVSAGS
jgi:hypothetical protein